MIRQKMPIEILRGIHAAVHADSVVYVGTVQQMQKPARIMVLGSYPRLRKEHSRTPAWSKLASEALAQSRPVFVPELVQWLARSGWSSDLQDPEYQTLSHFQSIAAIPMRSDADSAGAVIVAFSERQAFHDAEQILLERVVLQASAWLQHANAIDQGHRQSAHELQSIVRRIFDSLELQSVLSAALESAGSYLNAEGGRIAIYNVSTGELQVAARFGSVLGSLSSWNPMSHVDSDLASKAFLSKLPARSAVKPLKQVNRAHEAAPNTAVYEIAAPLIDNQTAIGVITFTNARPRAFSRSSLDFLVTVAHHAVVAIRNALAHRDARQAADERRVFIEVGKGISQHFEPRSTFDLILQEAIEHTGATFGTLHLIDPVRGDLYVVSELGGQDPEQRNRQVIGQGVVGKVAATGRLLNISDVTLPPWDSVYIPSIPGIRSELAAPMSSGDRILGVINVEGPHPFNFSSQHEELLTALADLATIAINNMTRYQQAEEGRQQIEALHQIDQELIRQVGDPEAAIRTILKSVLALTSAQESGISLVEGKKELRSYLMRHHEEGNSFKHTPLGRPSQEPEGVVAHVVSTRRRYRTDSNLVSDPYYVGDPDIRSVAAVPLLTTDLVGVLYIASSAPHAFGSLHLDLLELLAGQAVIAIQSARAYARAETDSARFQRLFNTSQRLSEVVDQEHLARAYEIVFNTVVASFPGCQVTMRHFDHAAEALVLIRSNEPFVTEPHMLPIEAGAYAWVAKYRQYVIIYDMDDPPPEVADMTHIQRPGEKSLAIIPVKTDNRFFGTLTVSHPQSDYLLQIPTTDLKLLSELAHQLAEKLQRLENLRVQRDLERKAFEAETLSELGLMTVELAHRLDDDLGLVKTHVNNIHDELAQNRVHNWRIEESLGKILRDVGIMLNLGNKLLRDVAVIMDQASAPRKKTRIQVAELLDTTARSYPSLPSNISVECCKVEPGADVVYAYNQRQIEAILYNLFVNAAQAMPAGGTIELFAYRASKGVTIAVKDTGHGIEENALRQVFVPFYSTKGSSGVGLWSARLIALRNDGELTVSSVVGRGTVFMLLLPSEEVVE
jgi:GAF domain-containing protein